jgi:PPOX class probable F420-dependent enzyme
MTQAPDPFRPLRGTKTVLLHTFKRDGSPVATPVSIAFDGDRVFFRTYDKAGKAKRLRRDPRVAVAPSTFRGTVTGPPINGQARLLAPQEAARAATALGRRHPVLQGRMVPLAHRVMRYRTLHYELLASMGSAHPVSTPEATTPMHAFKAAIASAREKGRADDLIALLAEDVIFRSPIVHTPYSGRNKVAPLLHAVVKVFDEFEFTRSLVSSASRDQAHVFRARLGDRELEGCDFIHTNDAGLIDEFFVMVRPISGAMALAEAMKQQLARDPEDSSAQSRISMWWTKCQNLAGLVAL